GHRRDRPRPGSRRSRCHRRRAGAAPRPEGPPPGSGLMNLNLSEWAIRHRSLVIYFMLVVVVAGVGSYLRLGRSEDPDFTIKTMVVQVGWPGATVSDTLEQITDRLERKLQETPSLDYLKSYTTPGKATIFVYLKDSTPPAQVPDIWYQVRKKVYDIRNDMPQGIVGPGFNDEFGDTYGIVYGFTADGFSHRELRDYVDEIQKQLLQLPDISKIDVLGAQDERFYVEFSTEQLAGLGIAPRWSPHSAPRTRSPPRAWCRPGTRKSSSASRARSILKRTSWPSILSRTAGSFDWATSRA